MYSAVQRSNAGDKQQDEPRSETDAQAHRLQYSLNEERSGVNESQPKKDFQLSQEAKGPFEGSLKRV